MLDFRMTTFLTVCQYMNFTQAAQRLHLTQPAVSQQMRYLEKYYDTALFVMEGKRLRLTGAGELLRQAALTMQHDERHMKRRLTQLGHRRSYAFGATLSVAEFMLPEDIKRMLRTEPQLQLRMQVGNTQALLQALDEGSLDFAIVEGEFPRTEYDSLLYARENFVAVGDAAMRARYRGRELRALCAERLILREPGSGSREILLNYFRETGLELSEFAGSVELGNIGAILELLRAGLGVSFMYETVLKRQAGQVLTANLQSCAARQELSAAPQHQEAAVGSQESSAVLRESSAAPQHQEAAVGCQEATVVFREPSAERTALLDKAVALPSRPCVCPVPGTQQGVGKIELADFALQHEIRFVFRKHSCFAEEYRRIFCEFKGLAAETCGGAEHMPRSGESDSKSH